MALTLQSPVTEARGLLNDTVATYRYSDTDMLQYANDCLDEMATLPQTKHLFVTTGDVTCTTNAVRQALTFGTALEIVDVVRIKNGAAITRADRATLDAFDPTWTTATSAAAKHWMPDPTSKIGFYIYPPSSAGQLLETRYVAVPSEYAIGADTGLPLSLNSAIADYICYRCELREDEYAVNGKAAGYYGSFLQKLGAA